MKKSHDKPSDAAELRRRAEKRLREKPMATGQPLTRADLRRLLQELQVHQIELEMQNEELQQAQVEIEAGLEKYTDLYDFAPTGYFTLAADGTILAVNLTGANLLGIERARLINRRFGFLVSEKDRPAFNAFFKKTFAGKAQESCEVTLPRQGTCPLIVRIEAVVTKDGQECRAAVADITERKHTEDALRVSHRFLEIANRHTSMNSLVNEVVVEVQRLTKCAAVGIRILDEQGNIPYQAYKGFDQRFYESESPLSIKSDQCMCINVIKGVTDRKLPFYTEGGSFYMNATTRFLATVSQEEKRKTRNECNRVGFESVALVPIRFGKEILGLIHVADSSENMVPLETVETLEKVAMQLGEAIQRLQAEEALRKTEERYRNLLEASPDVIVLMDLDYNILLCSHQAILLLGYESVGEVIGRNILEFLDPKDHQHFVGDMQKVLKRGILINIEHGFVRKNATRFPGEVSVSLILDAEGKPRAFIKVLRDITTRKRALAHLERMRQQQLKLKDRFLSHVSHEFRTPLAVIHQFVTLLLDKIAGDINEEQDNYLRIILRNTTELCGMVEDVLEVNRSESGKLTISPQIIGMDKLIEETINSFRIPAKGRGIVLNYDIPCDLPPVFADPRRLLQILTNLIDNAMKFTPQNGMITVHVEVYQDAPNYLRISVADTGCGIEPQELGNIFDRLYQAKHIIEDSRKGLGLGLSICKELVSRQAGRIWVESQVGRGSTFIFILPIFSPKGLLTPIFTAQPFKKVALIRVKALPRRKV